MDRKGINTAMDTKNSFSKLFDVPVTVSDPLLITMCDCKRRRTYGMTIMDLPRVIMVEILIRLPIKPIFRCKSVCKRWYNLVSHDPLFPKLYHSTCILLSVDVSAFDDNISSILELKAHYDYSSRPLDRPIMLSRKFHLPTLELNTIYDYMNGFRNVEPNLKLVGSCNGFICLFTGEINQDIHSVYISNPLLGEYFELKLPEWEKRIRRVAFGLCYSQASGQYKVLRSAIRKFRGRPEVSALEVYTLGVDEKWRNVGEAPYPLRSFGNVNVNGAVHWLNAEEALEKCAGIPSFNVGTEKLQTLPSPAGLETTCFYLSLVELWNCLCLSDNSYSANSHIDLWLMKKYGVAESWTRDRILMEFIPPIIVHDHGRVIPIVIWKDGEILMQRDRGTEFVSYSPKDKKFRKVKVHGSGTAATKFTPRFYSLKTIMGESFQISNVYPKTEIV